MKKVVFISIILFLCSTLANSEDGWFLQPSCTPHSLIDIFFVDSLNGWVSTQLGKVGLTTDWWGKLVLRSC